MFSLKKKETKTDSQQFPVTNFLSFLFPPALPSFSFFFSFFLINGNPFPVHTSRQSSAHENASGRQCALQTIPKDEFSRLATRVKLTRIYVS